jgi:anti-anti-sigma factor
MRLKVCLFEEPHGAVVSIGGALIASSVAELDTVLAACLARRAELLVLDLSGLHVCDSTGATLLIAAAGAGHDCGVPVVLAAPPAAVLRVLDVTGVLGRVPVYRSVIGAGRRDGVELVADPSETW